MNIRINAVVFEGIDADDASNHPDTEPVLNFELLSTERNTILRKIKEAMFICDLKPSINDKTECTILQRFLLKGDVIEG